ncbi:MAG TPA: Bax inhibitor-1/YccA family protein [Candidatus Dormibacteraeota bacterium]|nr:Bax inhibitor-1/YccA family protein [Candidatus Dormibacteraeota bacterium]
MSFDYARATAWDSSALSRVLGLLGLAAAITAGGALVGPALGVVGLWVSLIGGFVVLIALRFARNSSPINMVLFVVFSALEGVVLGDVLETYIAQGASLIVFQAAAATAVAGIAAGAVGYFTHRDLSRLGGFLFIGLVVVVVASLVGLFVQSGVLWTAISAVSALLFTGFLVFDINRVARAGNVSEGDAIVMAISVYLDVYNLFLDLLYLFGGRRGSR